MNKLFFAALAGIAIPTASVHADVIAYDNAAGITAVYGQGNGAGIQNFGGSLALDFNVNTPITVTALGVFDNGVLANLDGAGSGTGPGAGGVGTGVEIVNLSTGMPVPGLGEVGFSSIDSGTMINGDNFKSITPVVLPAGNYTVTAFNTDNYNSSGNPNPTSTDNTEGGAISFVGNGRWDTAHADVPSHGDGGPANRYDAGTFEFTVPEPATLGILGLAGVGLMGRWRRA